MSDKWKTIGVQWPAEYAELLAGEAAEYDISSAAFLRLLAEHYLGIQTPKRKPLTLAAQRLERNFWARARQGLE